MAKVKTIIKCVETGKYYASRAAVARKMFPGKSESNIIKNITGNKSYRGYHFKVIACKPKYEPLSRWDSICYICKNSNLRSCSWFNPDNPQPVKDWQAKRTLVSSGKSNKRVGYIVKKCPNFMKIDSYVCEVE